MAVALYGSSLHSWVAHRLPGPGTASTPPHRPSACRCTGLQRHNVDREPLGKARGRPGATASASSATRGAVRCLRGHQVDGQAPGKELEAGVADGRTHPLARASWMARSVSPTPLKVGRPNFSVGPSPERVTTECSTQCLASRCQSYSSSMARWVTFLGRWSNGSWGSPFSSDWDSRPSQLGGQLDKGHRRG
jgi:hypothetical protein